MFEYESPFSYGREGGDSWKHWVGSMPHKDLEGLDTNVLSKEQHYLVAAYMEDQGIDLDRGATLNSDNYGRNYWMQNYVDALDWARNKQSDIASGYVEHAKEDMNERSNKLAAYQDEVSSLYNTRISENADKVSRFVEALGGLGLISEFDTLKDSAKSAGKGVLTYGS